ncbi:hypothetical protein HDU93_008268 [Gonapodya sp. JEL0774]|nr:hypothetical protein HDU93_008268 [Gonapodya sp. JEL0774]
MIDDGNVFDSASLLRLDLQLGFSAANTAAPHAGSINTGQMRPESRSEIGAGTGKGTWSSRMGVGTLERRGTASARKGAESEVDRRVDDRLRTGRSGRALAVKSGSLGVSRASETVAAGRRQGRDGGHGGQHQQQLTQRMQQMQQPPALRVRPPPAALPFPPSPLAPIHSAPTPSLPTSTPESRALAHWSTVRAAFVSPPNLNLFGIQLSNFNNSPDFKARLNYQLQIRAGFQSRSIHQHKYPLVAVCVHPKPSKTAETSFIHGGARRGSVGPETGDPARNTLWQAMTGAHGATSPSINYQSSTIPAPPPHGYTLVCVDKSQTAHIWDLPAAFGDENNRLELDTDPDSDFDMDMSLDVDPSGSDFANSPDSAAAASAASARQLHSRTSRRSSHRPRASVHIGIDVTGIVFLPNIAMYAVRGHDTLLKLLRICSTTCASTSAPKRPSPIPYPNDWISVTHLDVKSRTVVIVGGGSGGVFSLATGAMLHRIPTPSDRTVTCVLYYEGDRYTIFGISDGSVIFKSSTFNLVRHLYLHTKAVTALAHYPHGPMIITAGMDKTVRVLTVGGFEEVYRLNFSEPVLSLRVIDDLSFHVRLSHRISVLTFNHLSTPFASLSSPVVRITCHKSRRHPRRILAWSADGTVRVMRPHARLVPDRDVVPARRSTYVKGETIATLFPVADQDRIVDVAYCRVLERVYLLMETGEIWCVATDVNPCAVADVWWRTGNDQEGLTHLVVFEGTLDRSASDPETTATSTPQSSAAPDPDRESTFVLLLAASLAGHLLVLGKGGVVVERFRVHDGAVTVLEVERKQGLVFTASADTTVKVFIVDVRSKQVLSPYLCINCGFVPRFVSPMDTILAVTDDQVVTMYMVDWQTSSTFKMGTFNLLEGGISLVEYRACEFSFGMCEEDLVIETIIVGIGDLPPGYLKSVFRMKFKTPTIEQPVPFSDDSDFFRLSTLLPPDVNRSTFTSAKNKDLRTVIDHAHIEHLKDRLSRRRTINWETSQPQQPSALRTIDSLVRSIEDSYEYEKSALKGQNASQTASNMIKRYLTRKNLGSGRVETSSPFLSREGVVVGPSSSSPGVVLVQVSDQVAMLEPSASDRDGLDVLSFEDEMNSPLKVPHVLETFDFLENRTLPIAPDGELPNSNPIQGLIDKWCIAHNIMGTRVSQPAKKNSDVKAIPIKVEGESRAEVQRKQTEYQDRIRRMMDKVKQQDEAKRRNEEERQRLLAEEMNLDEESENSRGSTPIRTSLKEVPPPPVILPQDSIDELERFQKGLREQKAYEESVAIEAQPTPTPVVEISRPIPELASPPPPMPVFLDRSFKYSWFPQDEVFYPVEDTIHAALGKKLTTRFKIDPEPDALQHLLVKLFQSKVTTDLIRKEIAEYHLWIYNEVGYRDTDLAMNAYIQVLHSPEVDEINNCQLRVTLVESIGTFAPNHQETLPLILELSQSRIELVRKRALQLMRYLGILHPQDSLLQSRIAKIVAQAQQGVSQRSPATVDLKPQTASVSELKEECSVDHSSTPLVAGEVKEPGSSNPGWEGNVPYLLSPVRQALLAWLKTRLRDLLTDLLTEQLARMDAESPTKYKAVIERQLEALATPNGQLTGKTGRRISNIRVNSSIKPDTLATQVWQGAEHADLENPFHSSDSLLDELLSPFEPAPIAPLGLVEDEISDPVTTKQQNQSRKTASSRWKVAMKFSGGQRLAKVVQDAIQSKKVRRTSSQLPGSREVLDPKPRLVGASKLPPVDLEGGDPFGSPNLSNSQRLIEADPNAIIESPTSGDFIAAINAYVSGGLRKIAAADQARQRILHERDRQQTEREDAALALAKMREFAARKSAEKRALADEEARIRRKRVTAAMKYPKTAILVEDEALEPPLTNKERYTTHRSNCHERREVTDYPLGEQTY